MVRLAALIYFILMLVIVSVYDALATDDGIATSILIGCCAAFCGLMGLQSCSLPRLGGGLIGIRDA